MTEYITDAYHWRRIAKYLPENNSTAAALGDRILAMVQNARNTAALRIELSGDELALVRDANSRIRWRRETGAALGLLA